MKVTRLKEALEMEDGEEPLCVSGSIARVYGRHTQKPGDKKKWSVQNVILVDNGSKMKVSIWDRAEIDESVVGKAAIFKATQNGKTKKWSGLKVEWSEERQEKSIRVRLSAEITIGGEPWVSAAEEGGEGEGEPEEKPSAKARRRAEAPTAPDGEGGGDGSQGDQGDQGEQGDAAPPKKEVDPKQEQRRAAAKAAKAIGKMGNAYKLCLYRAQKVVDWHAKKFPDAARIPGEAMKDMATTFFIEGGKRLLFEALPDNGDISDILPSLKVEDGEGD